MVKYALDNMDPAVLAQLLSKYEGHRKVRALDPFTQLKAILDLSTHAQAAEDQVRANIKLIDERSATIVNYAVPGSVVPGFTVGAKNETCSIHEGTALSSRP